MRPRRGGRIRGLDLTNLLFGAPLFLAKNSRRVGELPQKADIRQAS
jgi:hypothetical protein